MEAHCIWGICFVPLDASTAKFFGFSEFLAALALAVLAWTTTDYRYRFRALTAPVPLHGLTFGTVMGVGILTLLTDLWRAERWLVPVGHVISPAGWQALLGATFLATFALWAWFAFIRPPVFGRWNSFRFAGAIYSSLLRGSDSEIRTLAEEMWRSSKQIIEYSWTVGEMAKEMEADPTGKRLERGKRRASTHAYQLILMLGDKRFCRYAVLVPALAEKMFCAMSETGKHCVPISTFAKNFTEQAIENKDSFVYHEVEAYESGYIGFHKPITRAVYGTYPLLEDLQAIFDVDYRSQEEWDGDQWRAFERLLILCLQSYVKGGWINHHSFVLTRAIGRVSDSLRGLHALEDTSIAGYFKSLSYEKLRAALDFVDSSLDALDELAPEVLRQRKARPSGRYDVFDLVAKLMAEAVFAASTVKSPSMTSWGVQHNTVWGHFFGFREPSEAGRIVRGIFFRYLLEDIKDMEKFGPNYKGGRILAMLLNVMGLKLFRRGVEKGYAPLHRAVLVWTRKHFDALYQADPEVMEACMPDALTYDPMNCQIIKTYEKGLSREPARRFLKVNCAK
jgi:hypothetical protein